MKTIRHEGGHAIARRSPNATGRPRSKFKRTKLSTSVPAAALPIVEQKRHELKMTTAQFLNAAVAAFCAKPSHCLAQLVASSQEADRAMWEEITKPTPQLPPSSLKPVEVTLNVPAALVPLIMRQVKLERYPSRNAFFVSCILQRFRPQNDLGDLAELMRQPVWLRDSIVAEIVREAGEWTPPRQ